MSLNIIGGLPNLLTLTRIALIPIFIIIFYLPFTWAHYAAAVIFALASFTDVLDGYFARKHNQISAFGTFLDPVADKLLVACCLLLLVGTQDIQYITLPAIIIVGREMIVSALREWMAEIGQHASVAVNYIGKIKTCVQMLALLLLIAFHNLSSIGGCVGFILLYIAAILTIWSMIVYLKAAWPELIKKNVKE